MWQRDTSGDCPDEDEGSMSITDGSTSYMISGLEEDSSYSITVEAMNSIGMATSNTATGMTQEAGMPVCKTFLKNIVNLLHVYCGYCSSICCSHFCECI